MWCFKSPTKCGYIRLLFYRINYLMSLKSSKMKYEKYMYISGITHVEVVISLYITLVLKFCCEVLNVKPSRICVDLMLSSCLWPRLGLFDWRE